MKLKTLVAAIAAALAIVPVASARTHPHSHRTAQLISKVRAHATNHGSIVAVAATYLQVDKATIVTGLKAGQSLAQIATARGKTADSLVAALLAPAKLKLGAAVAAGKLTAARESAILTRLQTAVTKLVNRTPKPQTQPAARVAPAAILQPALHYLGLDLKGVIAQLRTGKTLADVAVAQGKTASGLVDAIVAAAKTKLDARVAAGKLTSAQETGFLATLQANVTRLVSG